MHFRDLILAALVLPLTNGLLFAQHKIYISADMEGVVGTVTGEQLSPGGFEYERSREFMTEEVLAAMRGARAAGATEFLVSDSHGNGQNLLIERFPEDVQIVRSWPRPLGMMEGIDETFDAVFFVGFHASTSNPEGVRAHTFSSATLTDVKLNGKSVSEASFNAAVAGHFGVPVVMISGDDVIVAEARSQIGDLEGAVVKRAISFHAAQTLTPKAAYETIEAAARRAIERIDDFQPLSMEGNNVELQIHFKHYRQAQMLSYLSTVERIDSHGIRYVGRDMPEISRFVEFVNTYEPGLSP
jgi:D-amino peptidase